MRGRPPAPDPANHPSVGQRAVCRCTVSSRGFDLADYRGTGVVVVRQEELIAELRALFDSVDPVPPAVLEQASDLYGWRTVDAELAELSYDSLVDRGGLAGVRHAGLTDSGLRLLGFETGAGGHTGIEIEVSGRRLLGQLVPAAPANVHVQCSRGPTIRVEADDLGRFRVEPVPRGPARLLIEYPHRTIGTAWMPNLRG